MGSNPACSLAVKSNPSHMSGSKTTSSQMKSSLSCAFAPRRCAGRFLLRYRAPLLYAMPSSPGDECPLKEHTPALEAFGRREPHDLLKVSLSTFMLRRLFAQSAVGTTGHHPLSTSRFVAFDPGLSHVKRDSTSFRPLQGTSRIGSHYHPMSATTLIHLSCHHEWS